MDDVWCVGIDYKQVTVRKLVCRLPKAYVAAATDAKEYLDILVPVGNPVSGGDYKLLVEDKRKQRVLDDVRFVNVICQGIMPPFLKTSHRIKKLTSKGLHSSLIKYKMKLPENQPTVS